MPTLVWRCEDHGDFEQWRSIHSNDIARCPECRLAGTQVFTPPNISVWALENKGGQAKYALDREARFDKDGPAYNRLRKEGLQPRGIDRCARIEQGAETRLEVEMGKPIPKDRRSEALEVNQELRENARRSDITPQLRDVVKGTRKEVVV